VCAATAVSVAALTREAPGTAAAIGVCAAAAVSVAALTREAPLGGFSLAWGNGGGGSSGGEALCCYRFGT
jgi:hypothetical protein